MEAFLLLWCLYFVIVGTFDFFFKYQRSFDNLPEDYFLVLLISSGVTAVIISFLMAVL